MPHPLPANAASLSFHVKMALVKHHVVATVPKVPRPTARVAPWSPRQSHFLQLGSDINCNELKLLQVVKKSFSLSVFSIVSMAPHSLVLLFLERTSNYRGLFHWAAWGVAYNVKGAPVCLLCLMAATDRSAHHRGAPLAL